MRTLTFVSLIGLSLCLVSSSTTFIRGQSLKKVKVIPPGTNHLTGNLLMDITEIDNMSWLEYMYWTERIYGKESSQFKATLPDTLVWRTFSKDFELKASVDRSEIESLTSLYLRHPAYQYHPVVGVSFEQANMFCEWRTNRVNEMLYVKEHKELNFPLDTGMLIPKKVFYRLPTKEEWELAALTGFDSTKLMKQKADKIYYYTLEYSLKHFECKNPVDYVPLSVMALKQDKSYRYNLIGNAAEMINIKGIAKGGSYIHSIKDCSYNSEIMYDKEKYWLGFRCVCEILATP